MRYTEFREWQKLIEKFKRTLIEAQELRDSKGEWINNELEWITYERDVMFRLTNQERENRGLNPVRLEDIKKCENYAAGHVDYTNKFALYCCELAVGEM